MLECDICKNKLENYRKLSKHIRDRHDMTPRIYYDSYLKKDHDGFCKYCKVQTKFININNGYSTICKSKNCMSFLMRDIRKQNADNLVKQETFINKVKKNQQRIWNERKNDGTEVDIRKKIGNTIKYNNKNLSKDDINIKYNWRLRRSSQELNDWKNSVMKKTGMFKWYSEATYEQLQELYKKRSETIRITHRCYDRSKKHIYYRNVMRHTEKTYRTYKNQLDPHSSRGVNYHLDHKYSIIQGFLNNIDPIIIGSIYNLQILSSGDNMKKKENCSIELDILLEKYYGS